MNGVGHIEQPLLSCQVGGEPVLIELVWGLVPQGLMGAHSLVAPIPGQEGLLQPAQVGVQVRQIVDSSSSVRKLRSMRPLSCG